MAPGALQAGRQGGGRVETETPGVKKAGAVPSEEEGPEAEELEAEKAVGL